MVPVSYTHLSGWVNMPGGLIQSVLCDEVFASEYDRLDEIFYYTMINIKDPVSYTHLLNDTI